MSKLKSNKAEKVVLAYSGGLDTSIIIPWLKENCSCEVIAMVADVGQGDDIEAVIKKAYDTGASKVVVEDLREEFLRGYVFPAVQAGAVYEHKYLLGTSLARPVIAKHQVEVALREGATSVATIDNCELLFNGTAVSSGTNGFTFVGGSKIAFNGAASGGSGSNSSYGTSRIHTNGSNGTFTPISQQ